MFFSYYVFIGLVLAAWYLKDFIEFTREESPEIYKDKYYEQMGLFVLSAAIGWLPIIVYLYIHRDDLD